MLPSREQVPYWVMIVQMVRTLEAVLGKVMPAIRVSTSLLAVIPRRVAAPLRAQDLRMEAAEKIMNCKT